jgi:hypothetical protein
VLRIRFGGIDTSAMCIHEMQKDMIATGMKVFAAKMAGGIFSAG